MDAFLIAFEDLQRVGGHLFERLECNQVYAFGPRDARGSARGIDGDLPKYRARHVVRDVPAADDDDAATQVHRLAERNRAQQIDTAVHARATFAGQAEPARALRADGDDDRGEVATKLGKRNVLSHGHAAADFNAQRSDDLNFARDEFARQPVFRNADH
jgi:hypothetical protein